jgi:hypothetical protein
VLCCARATSGHAIPALLRSVMNSRRSIRFPRAEGYADRTEEYHIGIRNCVDRLPVSQPRSCPLWVITQHCSVSTDVRFTRESGHWPEVRVVPIADITNRYASAVLGGRNLAALISPIRTKMASTTACVIAKGGSVCVGANAVRAEPFTKLCTTKTKTLR